MAATAPTNTVLVNPTGCFIEQYLRDMRDSVLLNRNGQRSIRSARREGRTRLDAFVTDVPMGFTASLSRRLGSSILHRRLHPLVANSTARAVELILEAVIDEVHADRGDGDWLRLGRDITVRDEDSTIAGRSKFVLFQGDCLVCVVELIKARRAGPAQIDKAMAQAMLTAAILSDNYATQYGGHRPTVCVITTNLAHWNFRRIGRQVWQRSPTLDCDCDDLGPKFVRVLHRLLGTLVHYLRSNM